jgi:hypothetical protein
MEEEIKGLTEEEKDLLERIFSKTAELTSLTWIRPIFDHERIDPKIRKKLLELKQMLAEAKIKEVV